jgi:hypothetical protein
MSTGHQRPWCLFTSAGDKNAIRLWLDGAAHRRWDLVIAYYGDNDHEFSEITKASSYAFRTKGAKFQNLKKLVERHPQFFAPYSHVWVCDDDIKMSSAQIEEAFAITERFDFWVAQPAFRPEGKISHWITCYAGAHCDYRIVNYVEMGVPIFRRDKFSEFLSVYDGSLAGYGVEIWYTNFFKANEFGRLAIIDKVQVINPFDEEKGGREIDRLQPAAERMAAWLETKKKYGLVEFPHKVFSYCKMASNRGVSIGVERPPYEFPPELQNIIAWLDMHRPGGWHEGVTYLRALDDNAAWHIAVRLVRGFSQIKQRRCNIIHRSSPPYIVLIQNLERYSPAPDRLFREIAEVARTLKIDSVPTFGVSYSVAGAVTDVRFERFQMLSDASDG